MSHVNINEMGDDKADRSACQMREAIDERVINHRPDLWN